ncbi:MAG: hypothetical protein RH859_01975 [Longimicrobiales bacterium]
MNSSPAHDPTDAPGPSTDRVTYRVDAEGVILDTGDGWDSFAEAGGAPHLLHDSVVGRRLDDFLGHATTRAIYRMLRERVRGTGRPVTFPYRCDAPGLRRWMTMEMQPQPDGGTLFRTWPDQVEERPPVPVTGGPASGDAADGHLLLMCGWCKRVKEDQDSWWEIEDAMARPPLVDALPLVWITHGMCLDCEARMQRILDEELAG